jgi:uncharacterized Zn finger protein
MAQTFWGKRWCEHFDGMADFANRLPRGRTYARNGSIIHLDITPGKVFALVSGGSLYEINITVAPLKKGVWNEIKKQCHGEIGTMLDLLKGQFSEEVMQVVCDPKNGLFPRKNEIQYKCSCPDWADLCKHLAAVFYGIGNRLDTSPELLFVLRQVDPIELLSVKADELAVPEEGSMSSSELSQIFGVELDTNIKGADSPAGGLKGLSASRKTSGHLSGKDKTASPAAVGEKRKPKTTARSAAKPKTTARSSKRD